MTPNEEGNQIPSDVSRSRIRKEWTCTSIKFPTGHRKASVEKLL